jgi:RNA polymerase sigma factor (TIGR02999 family)
MSSASPPPTAELLAHARAGDKDAFDLLYTRLYRELRPIARRQLLGQRRSATLDTTTLIHETYARLLEESLPAQSRAHFLAIAARAMRRVIVDGARAAGAQKRGGGWIPLTLPSDGQPGVIHDIETLVTIDQALAGLAAFNERLERVAECRLFGGLTDEETAAALGISVRTVQRDWPRARAWLQQHLGD